MSSLPDVSQQRETWQQQIDAACNQLHSLLTTHGLSSRCLGHEAADLQLWSIGQQWLQQNAPDAVDAPLDGPDVYLTSQLFTDGGHTPLIGDFVRALDHPSRPAPHLVLTNHHRQNVWPLEPQIINRTSIPSDNLHHLDGESLLDRLDQLFQLLLQLRPGRLFLFHHPGDPLACIVAHSQIAPQRVLVHHADAIPSFGLHLPGTDIIDLNPYAAAFTRIQSLHSNLLPLTCPDPGARPPGFLQRGHLVTASCGSLGKFRTPYHLRYHETVAFVLQQTQGWHVHIGALEENDLHEIHSHLKKRGVPTDRLVHVPWTPSLARCLWEHQVDVYLASFPITGARANAEVAAAATPHLAHQKHSSLRTASAPSPGDLTLKGSMPWRTWQELSGLLLKLQELSVLEENSQLIRSSYERAYHPEVFQKTLLSILSHKQGWLDPQADQTDQVIVKAMFKSLIQATSHLHSQTLEIPALRRMVKQQKTELQKQSELNLAHQSRIDFLQEQRKKLRDDLQALQRKVKKNRSVNSSSNSKLTSLRIWLKKLFRRHPD